jgi:hypothetical protein
MLVARAVELEVNIYHVTVTTPDVISVNYP